MELYLILFTCYKDIDECHTLNGGCEHNCHNLIGTYECSCNDGYLLETDGHHCRGTLYILTRHTITHRK